MPLPADDTYLTIGAASEGLYKEKGSKFIALAFPADSETQVKEILAQVRKKYYDAHHHCYAYILGDKGQHYRANDDGEPAHSAGDPILGQIRSRHLTHTLVIVVRYFGGIKLGVSGLIQAYKTAASDALTQGSIIEKIVEIPLTLRFSYQQMNQVMKLVKDYELKVIHQQFAEQCELGLLIRKGLLEEAQSKLLQLGVEIITDTTVS
ncbi:YigZ family protein [Rhodocytophaga rosea]|uniref:YigZ family protein n=1 Tax=Rhodocytophaga rosea TaxID=2704465 RepID=A0A6C0GV60_9BACT|nr:YigZ family protein [Rhodocytophaga rosea]QHT71240.1 YigZ family protein [Rhodocytophaga rosea]